MNASEIPEEAFFPGMGLPPGVSPAGYATIGIPKNALQQLTEKIVRGTTFALDKMYIEADRELAAYPLEEARASQLHELMDQYGEKHYRGPGFMIARAVPHEDPQSGFFRLEIWGRIIWWAIVRPKALGGGADDLFRAHQQARERQRNEKPGG